jgi:HD superfamily phosphodiesterase
MTHNQFEEIKQWFDDYIYQFHSEDPAFQRNIELKRDHSYNVWNNTIDLGNYSSLNESEYVQLQTAGLLHDVGRFEQFRRYHTFSDKKSVNHGLLGVEVLKEKNILKELSSGEQNNILTAIENHNKKEIRGNYDASTLTMVKMLRDADKLDIWRVVTEYYCNNEGETNNTLQLDLPDNEEINPKNYHDLLNNQMVDLSNLKTLNDFKLLQVGWIYDLNYKRSFQILNEKKYLDIIFKTLPNTEEIRTIQEKTNNYLQSQV